MVVSNDSNIVGRLRSEFCGSHRERPVSGGDLPFVALSSTHFCGAGNAYFRPGKDIPQPPGNDNYAATPDVPVLQSVLTLSAIYGPLANNDIQFQSAAWRHSLHPR
jgi:hypothetical protein